MLLYSNFVCYNQVFAPKSGLLSQKMPNAALIKSAVVFASIRYCNQKLIYFSSQVHVLLFMHIQVCIYIVVGLGTLCHPYILNKPHFQKVFFILHPGNFESSSCVPSLDFLRPSSYFHIFLHFQPAGNHVLSS